MVGLLVLRNCARNDKGPGRHNSSYCMRTVWFGRGAALTLAVALCLPAQTQVATPVQRGRTPIDVTKYGTLHLSTRLGSFRLINGQGRVEFTFTGTVLLNRVEAGSYGPRVLSVSGNLRKEYEEGDRIVYSGTGRVIVEGKWRAINWFGRDMNAVWYGQGIARVMGDFDRNLETGRYWYDNPNLRQPWPAGSIREIRVPENFGVGLGGGRVQESP